MYFLRWRKLLRNYLFIRIISKKVMNLDVYKSFILGNIRRYNIFNLK